MSADFFADFRWRGFAIHAFKAFVACVFATVRHGLQIRASESL